MKQAIALLFIIVVTAEAFAGTPGVTTGIEVLRNEQFAPLKGKRVGLITNPTGVDSRLRSTWNTHVRPRCEPRSPFRA